MLDDRIIVLVGLNKRQIDWWKKQIFSYDEYKNLKIVEATEIYSLWGYRDGWYMLVGEWAKMPWLQEIVEMLEIQGFHKIDLIFEEPDAI